MVNELEKPAPEVNELEKPAPEVNESEKPVKASSKGFMDEMFQNIQGQLRDISSVEVITATGDAKLKIDSKSGKGNIIDALGTLQILARTTIELDGDICVILPTKTTPDGEIKINQEILNIHKQNVDAAVQNWKSFMDTILNAVTVLAKLAGLNDLDVREKFGVSVAGPS